MKKTMILVTVFALAVFLAACQAQEGEDELQTIHQDDNGQTLTQQSETEHEHAHEEKDGHQHADNEKNEHSHAHDEQHHAHADHDHHHGEEDEEAKQIYAGYFEDRQIQDRELSDWFGDWQSVYPYLLDGTLDEVFEHKARSSDSMSAAQYKQYYDVGYKTTVDRIAIKDNQVSFYDGDQINLGEYVYDGYEVLTYEKGNRGVRYIFKLAEQLEGKPPMYIQFSDHRIFPTEADHFHLYWGDDRAALLEELENWPTYYPSEMDGHTIVHEMIAH